MRDPRRELATIRDPMARLTAPVPASRLAWLRILVGGYAVGYLLVRFPHLWGVAGFDDVRFDPVGPLGLLDAPTSSGLNRTVLVAAVALGAAFVAGWRWRATGPLFAVAFLAVTTYRNSWGQVFHTENLVALHLVVLSLGPAAAAHSLDRRRAARRSRSLGATPSDPNAPLASYRYGVPVRLCSLVTVLAYAVAGWAKWRNGGLQWITGDVLANQVAHDNLRKALMGDTYSPVAGVALRHDWLFLPMAAVSVAVELGAPLALLVRQRLRAVWIASAWLFHVGVLALMAIGFPYPLTGIAFASMVPLERIPGWISQQVPRPVRLRRGTPTIGLDGSRARIADRAGGAAGGLTDRAAGGARR